MALLDLLAVWALGLCTIGVKFRLRPRWSETLDGVSMFRFDSDQLGFSIDEAAYVQHFSHCQGLRKLPGMVGASKEGTIQASKDTEHVTLIGSHEVYDGDQIGDDFQQM